MREKMDIELAIYILRDEYEKSQNNPTIHTPLAYAPYQTWKRADKERV